MPPLVGSVGEGGGDPPVQPASNAAARTRATARIPSKLYVESSPMELRDAVCLVTGASSGIGRETAIALARRSAVVAVCARRKDKLDDTLAECLKQSPRSISMQCDVADAEAVQQMVDEVIRTLGQIDVLVANAGIGRYVAFDEETIESI